MIDSALYSGLRIRGGFVIVRLEFIPERLLDPIGRTALAQTEIIGRKFRLKVFAGLSAEERSVSIYHEILEAATVASPNAPADVQDFNEGDFERAAYKAQARFGEASPENLNLMLQFHGFRENLKT